MPREAKKCKVWEKDRRDRLNIQFEKLGKLLPSFDPSLKISKVEILDKAAKYIEELLEKNNKDTSENPKSENEELKKLSDRINKLLGRNELLNNLLKNAGIKTPKEYGCKAITPKKKWSQKINPNLAKVIAKKEAQKENNPNGKSKRKLKIRPNQKRGSSQKKKTIQNPKNKCKLKKKVVVKAINPNLVTIANVQPCYFIGNSTTNLPQKSSVQTVVVNSTPILSTNIQSSKIITNTIPTNNPLPTGTLFLTNNNIMIPQQLSQPLININQQLPTFILVSNTSTTTNAINNNTTINSAISDSSKVSKITRSLPAIKPKRTITTTTQINKVPIPALTSSYSKNYLTQVNNIKVCSRKTKKVVKAKQNKVTKESTDDQPKLVDTKKRKANEENVPSKVAKLDEQVDSTFNTTTNLVLNVLCPENSNVINTKDKDATVADEVIEKSIKIISNSETTEKIDEVIEDVSKKVIIDNELLKTIDTTTEKNIETMINSELSNDIFATLQVPAGSQNPESTSPTAAFLMAFPLVSSLTGGKIHEVLEEETSDSRRDTPTLLQIGTMDVTKTTQKQTDTLTPCLMNLDSFSFFSAKDICRDIYQPFESIVTSAVSNITPTITATKLSEKEPIIESNKEAKIIYESVNSKVTTDVSSIKLSHKMNSEKAVVKKDSVPHNVVSNIADHSINRKQSMPVSNVNLSNQDMQITSNLLHNNPSNTLIVNNQVNQQQISKTITNQKIVPNLPTSVNLNNQMNLSRITNQKILSNEILPTNQPIIKSAMIPQSTNLTNNVTPVNSVNQVMIANALNISHSSISNQSTMINQSYYTTVTSTVNSSISSTDLNYSLSKTKSAAADKFQKYPTIQTQSKLNSIVPEYNTLNPFNDLPKTNAGCSFNVPTTKTVYPEIYGSNTANCHYGYQSTNKYYGYENYTGSEYKNDSNNFCGNYYPENKNKFTVEQKPVNKIVESTPRAPVNWMTTPDVKQHQNVTDFTLFPPAVKEIESTNNFVANQNNNYFNAAAPIYPITTEYNTTFTDTKKYFELQFQRNDTEEHQINWSPTKHSDIEPVHNFGTTLPTLVGDLALGTSQVPYVDPKLSTIRKDNQYKSKDTKRVNAPNMEVPGNFLSVSQLVDHCSKPAEIPPKISSRRNSGGRSKTTNVQSKSKRGSSKLATDCTKDVAYKQPNKNQFKQNAQVHSNFVNDNWVAENKRNNHVNKNVASNSYSAEALIGHTTQIQPDSKQRNNQQYNYHITANKSLAAPTFLSDNIMPYFPTVDLPAESNATIQQNQNYHQSNSFSAASFPVSIQNSYNNTTYNIPTTSYIQPPNYIPDLPNHDFGTLNDNIFSHVNVKTGETNKPYQKLPSMHNKTPSNAINKVEEKRNQFAYTNTSSYLTQTPTKKTKRKTTNEINSSTGIADFSFLPMPGNMNSPLLPDELHSNFLPPPNPHQLYPCKTSIYKQNSDLTTSNLINLPSATRSNIQHPEISPSSNNIGTTLTNFNLSTIFPEINKISMPSENYLDCKNKTQQIPFTKGNYSHSNHYNLTTSTPTFTNP